MMKNRDHRRSTGIFGGRYDGRRRSTSAAVENNRGTSATTGHDGNLSAKTRHGRNTSATARRHLSENTSERIYELLDNTLPVRPSMSVVAACLAVMFIVFAMACFAAAVFGSSSAKLDDAQANANACSSYYDAETTATDILTTLAADNGASLTDENGELKYDGDGNIDEITISHNGDVYSFSVPIVSGLTQNDAANSQDNAAEAESLHVIARISGGIITPIEWYVETAR